MRATARAEEPSRTPATPAPRPERRPQHSLLHLQRTAGNTAVTSALARGHHLVQRAQDDTTTEGSASTSAAPSPFTYKNFRFTNLNHTEAKYRDKAVRLLGLLDKHASVRKYVGDRPCHITLRLRAMEAPADIQDRGEMIEINLASYYFEKYDMGYITGMLMHEFGIHPMAAGVEGIGEEEETFAGFPMLVPGLENSRSPRLMNSAEAKEPQHIFGVAPERKRFQKYRDVALEMATTLAAEAEEQEEGASPKDVTDMLDCFLMDLATIAVGNDDRVTAAKNPNNVATVYNRYKALIREGLADNSPIKPLFPSDKSFLGVATDFLTLRHRIMNDNKGASMQQPAAATAPTPRPA